MGKQIDVHERAENLLKEATSFKKTDINKAISLIKEALSLVSDDAYSITFKLASYLHLGGYKNDAFDVLENALQSVNIDNIGLYNTRRSIIIRQKRLFFEKEKLKIQSIKSGYLSDYNQLLGFACQGGRIIEFNNMLDRFFEPGYNPVLASYIKTILPVLSEIVRIADETNSDKELFRTGDGSSVGDIFNNHLKKNENFMKYYNQVNDGTFESLLNDI